VLLHPNLSQLYRQQVARPVEALNDEHHRTEAAEIIRGLVDRIELTPKEEDGARTLTLSCTAHWRAYFRWPRTARGRRRTAASRFGK
jgi:hypothetical protein